MSEEDLKRENTFSYEFGQPSFSKNGNDKERRGSIISYQGKKYICSTDDEGNSAVVKDDKMSTVRLFESERGLSHDPALYVKINKSSSIDLKKEYEITQKVNIGTEAVWHVTDSKTNEERLITLEKKGQSLHDFIKINIKNCSYEYFLNLIISVLKAIDGVHKMNIVHGDFNPVNILVDETENMLVDEKNGGFDISIIDWGQSLKVGEKIEPLDLKLSKNIYQCSIKQQRKIYANFKGVSLESVNLSSDDIKTYLVKEKQRVFDFFTRKFFANKYPHYPNERGLQEITAAPSYDVHIFLSYMVRYMRQYDVASKYLGIYKVIAQVLSKGLKGVGSIRDCIKQLEKVREVGFLDEKYMALYFKRRANPPAEEEIEIIRRVYQTKDDDLSYIENAQLLVVFCPKTDLFFFPLSRENGTWDFGEALLICIRIHSLLDLIHEKGVVNVLSKQCKMRRVHGRMFFCTSILEGKLLDEKKQSEKGQRARYIFEDKKRIAGMIHHSLKDFVDCPQYMKILKSKLSEFVNGSGEGSPISILKTLYMHFSENKLSSGYLERDFSNCMLGLWSFDKVLGLLVTVFNELHRAHKNVVGFMVNEKALLFNYERRPMFSCFKEPAIFVNTDALIEQRNEKDRISVAIAGDIAGLLKIINNSFQAYSKNSPERYLWLEIYQLHAFFSKTFSSISEVLSELNDILESWRLSELCKALGDPKSKEKGALMSFFKMKNDGDGGEQKVPQSVPYSKNSFKLFLTLIMQRTGNRLSRNKTTKSALLCVDLLNSKRKFKPLRHHFGRQHQNVDYGSLYRLTGENPQHFFKKHAKENLQAIRQELDNEPSPD